MVVSAEPEQMKAACWAWTVCSCWFLSGFRIRNSPEEMEHALRRPVVVESSWQTLWKG